MFAPTSTQAALTLLTEVVRDYESRGRSTLAAGIKPEMQRRRPGFDERQLGYARFLDFLDFAAEQNVVTVTHHGGQPLVALPLDAAAPANGTPSRRPRVRPDLWRAFTNWGAWRRAWDIQSRRAVMIPAEPGPRDLDEHAAIRSAWETEPDRFVEIPAIPQDVQIGWMQEFADAQRGSAGLLMRYALREEGLKARAFSQAAREDPATYARWMDLRVKRTIDTIQRWQETTGTKLDIFDAEWSADTSPATVPRRTTEASAPTSDDDLRRVLHAAIDKMTRAELLRIAIPLEHVVDQPA